MMTNTHKLLLAAFVTFHAGSAAANAMCDTLGETAEGVASTRRDKGVSEQTVLDQVNEKKPGGLSEENRAMMVSLVHMVYARRDLSPEQLNEATVSGCERIPPR